MTEADSTVRPFLKYFAYEKDYKYDSRLRYRSPPFFLDPISASWRIIRANEQVPAPKT